MEKKRILKLLLAKCQIKMFSVTEFVFGLTLHINPNAKETFNHVNLFKLRKDIHVILHLG